MSTDDTMTVKQCEWTGCVEEAVETVEVGLLDVFEDEHHLCEAHAEDVRNTPLDEVDICD